MRLTSAGMFLLLFSALQATDVQEKEVRALVGSDVELSCVFPERHSFDLNDLYVYWQTSVVGTPKTVVTYYLSGNSSAGHEDNRYRDRARLSLESMKRGDFSLHLHNITPQDEQRFNCLVFRKSLELEKILDVVVTLHVAANYSMPVVRAPSGPSENEELTFMCTSVNGYPRPNVYWINKTDNSLLNETLQNNTVSLNAQGLYDVVSVLTIRQTPSVNVGCCIENVLLHQNLTTISTQAGKVPRGLSPDTDPRLWACGDSGGPLSQKTEPLQGAWAVASGSWKEGGGGDRQHSTTKFTTAAEGGNGAGRSVLKWFHLIFALKLRFGDSLHRRGAEAWKVV
uniref:ICOS ligand n=1 Tax=Panthera leo TaxID=9689 RepID=A0A8C8XX59_PANLE